MSDPAEDPGGSHEETDGPAAPDAAESTDPEGGEDLEALREEVADKYDFESFGPAEMDEMTVDEWEVAFDDDAWVTGAELLDRVEADLRSRVADRDVFAVVERTADGDRLVAYSERSYAVVYPDGTVEGEGPVFQDVKPTVALTSMPEYGVPESPPDEGLPEPESVPVETGGLGNVALQVVAAVLGIAALVLLGAALTVDLGGATIVAVFVGFLFLAVAVALLLAVANSRLSARYRAEEYRDRLRGAGVGRGERPDFLPVDDSEFEE